MTIVAERAQSTVSVWRNRRLQTLNLGNFAANLGTSVADVVYPLLILGFTGKPLLAGLFGTVQFTAMLLSALPAGALLDRRDRRRVLIAGELVRALTATVLAVSLAAGHVWLPEVYLAAFALGACQPLSASRTLVVRSVVPEAQLTPALAAVQIVAAMASLLGPALGAAMFTASRSLPFTVTAAVMGISATCAFLVRFVPRAAAGPTAFDADDGAPGARTAATATAATASASTPASASPHAKEDESPLAGLRIVWNSVVMRTTLLFIMMVNLIGVPLDLVIILEARHQGVPTRYLGAIIAAFAVGGLIGAPLVPRVHALLRPGQLLTAFGLLAGLFIGLLAVPFGGFWMAACLLTVGLLLPAVEILVSVLILQQVPDRLRGRVMSAVGTFIGLGTPLGAALGGTLLQLLSPVTVLLGAGALLAAVALTAYAQPALRAARWTAEHAHE